MQYLDFIEDAASSASNVAVLRSAYAAAAAHPGVRRARELAAFVASANKPHQRVHVLEDVFHRGIDALYRQLSEALLQQVGMDASHPTETDAPMQNAAAAPVEPTPVVLPPEPATDTGGDEDDLLASLLADIDSEGMGVAVEHAPSEQSAAIAPLTPAPPPVVTPPSASTAIGGHTSLSSSRPTTLSLSQRLECRAVAAGVWLANHISSISPGGAAPIVVLLVPDGDPITANVPAVERTRLLAHSIAAPDLLLEDFTTKTALRGASHRGGGLAVLTPSQYLEGIAPTLAPTLHTQAVSLSLKLGDGAAATAAAGAARFQSLRAMVDASQQTYAASLQTTPGNSAVADSTAVGNATRSVASDAVPARRRSTLFPPHSPHSEVSQWVRLGFRPAQHEAGIPSARVVRGIFSRSRSDREEGSVKVRGGSGGGPTAGGGSGQARIVRLRGREACNRAIDGDEVAVELLPGSGDGTLSSVSARSAFGSDVNEDTDSPVHRLSGGSSDRDEAGETGDGAPALASDALQPASTAAMAADGEVCGRVISILNRRTAPIVASVPVDALPALPGASPDSTEAVGGVEVLARRSQWVLVTPMDARLPRIRMHSRQVSRLAGFRILVALDGWPADAPHPEGHYVRTIGRALEVDTEVQCVMLSTGVHTHARPFPPAAVACLPPLPPSGRWSVAWDRAQHLLRLLGAEGAAASLLNKLVGSVDSASDTPGFDVVSRLAAALSSGSDRRDLRWSHEICSVDPPGCTDIDDALHARIVPPSASGSGMFRPPRRIEVGVHIADVTSFVPYGCDLDLEARARGTTVYLVDRRLDMLPKALSENVCSLRARVDRHAFSVIWELEEQPGSSDARPLFTVVPDRTWVGRTIIRSTHALTYYQAQRLVAGRHADEDGGAEAARLAASAAAPASDPLAADLSVLSVLSESASADLLDPSRLSHDAVERLGREARLYPCDPPEGGLCGAPVHCDDEPRLAVSLRLLTSAARWLGQGRAAAGSLEFERGEIRFVLERKDLKPGAAPGQTLILGAAGSVGETAPNFALPTAPLPGEAGAAAVIETPEGGADGDAPPSAPASTIPSVVEPVGLTVKHGEEIHATIAELMIFANQATAKLAYAAFPAHALLRHHPPADQSRFGELVATAAAAGFSVDVSTNGALQRSLSTIVGALSRPGAASAPQAALLRQLALWAMTRAAYFPTASPETGASAAAATAVVGSASSTTFLTGDTSRWDRTPGGAYVPRLMEVSGPADFAHYGLAVDLYTHFTSPIRRYADDVVHKLLAAALGLPVTDVDIALASAGVAVAKPAPTQLQDARVSAPMRALPSSVTPSVAGMIDWSLGDKPQGATIADALSGLSQVPDNSYRAHGCDGGDESDDLLDALLGGGSGGGSSNGPPAGPDLSHSPLVAPYSPVAVEIPSQRLGTATPPFDSETLTSLCAHLNERNQAAKVAGWECDELFLALYFRSRLEVLEAVVSDVRAAPSGASGNDGVSVHVYVPKYQFAAQLHLTGPQQLRGLPTAERPVAVPPALLGLRGTTYADDDPSRLVPGAQIIANKLPACDRAALLREGALRTASAGASITSVGGAVTVMAQGGGRHLTLSILDRVLVAVTCDFDVKHARRPPIIVELLADTPAVRALMARATDGAVITPTPTIDAAAASAAALPPPLPAQRMDIRDSSVKPASVYNALTAASPVASTAPLPLIAPSRQPRRSRSAPPAPAPSQSLAKGRARYGGYAPPAALRAEDLHEGPTGYHDEGDFDGGLGGGAGFGLPAGVRAALEFHGQGVGWKRPAAAAAARVTHADPSRPAAGWGTAAENAWTAPSATRIVFGGAPPDTTYIGRLHSGEESAYSSKTGAGLASFDLLGSYGGLQSAQREAMARHAKRAAERKHDRIDKAKRAEKGGKK